jgi:hypothetical protein
VDEAIPVTEPLGLFSAHASLGVNGNGACSPSRVARTEGPAPTHSGRGRGSSLKAHTASQATGPGANGETLRILIDQPGNVIRCGAPWRRSAEAKPGNPTLPGPATPPPSKPGDEAASELIDAGGQRGGRSSGS